MNQEDKRRPDREYQSIVAQCQNGDCAGFDAFLQKNELTKEQLSWLTMEELVRYLEYLKTTVPADSYLKSQDDFDQVIEALASLRVTESFRDRYQSALYPESFSKIYRILSTWAKQYTQQHANQIFRHILDILVPEQSSVKVTSLPGDLHSPVVRLGNWRYGADSITAVIRENSVRQVIVQEDEEQESLLLGVCERVQHSDTTHWMIRIEEWPILIRFVAGKVRIDLDTIRIHIGMRDKTIWNSNVVVDLTMGDDPEGSLVLNNSSDTSPEEMLEEIRKRVDRLEEALIRFGDKVFTSPEQQQRVMRNFKF